ncbi:MAG: FKBP-type peptidyl-prolyl cis-trans isomerase [Opitutaceae bacterium]|nr:FKBP-type peptidyl-prolyl cis-trans isomerase [Cephaloticoccus sp.]MCP5530716.1 FKBP-type peptidyl-prolyl cis-trans isomerase [Opitutaceae bacterium]
MKSIPFLRGLFGLCVFSATLLGAEEAPAYTTTESGLQYAITAEGDGPTPQPGQVVIAHYTGKLADGTVFDSSRERGEPFAFTLGQRQVIKGWDEGFALLHVGDHATFIIPSNLAYGEKGAGDRIPPGSTLRFDVEFVDVKQHALADHLQEIIDRDGVDAALARFVELKEQDFGDYYVSEAQLNSLGYRYLGKDQLPAAIAVFKLNVELFPLSGNTHDSLGEALLKNGQTTAAIAAYEQSVKLDPKNENALRILAELKSADVVK